MTAVAKLLSHLREGNPRFLCSRAGTESAERLELSIEHSLAGPATPEDLRLLRRLLGEHATLVEELYSQHDGLDLYLQPPENAALVLYPIAKWEEATETFKADLEDWGRSVEDAYEFEINGVVIGEPAFSGNHIFLYKGVIYYSDHDGGDDTPLAPNFPALLERLVDDPAKLLYDLGCYARYSDGKTDAQWIPEAYVSDERPA